MTDRPRETPEAGEEGARGDVRVRVPPAMRDALRTLQQALRTDERLYHDCVLCLRRLQRTNDGPLTEALAVLVGRE